jgi:hypothetical protein
VKKGKSSKRRFVKSRSLFGYAIVGTIAAVGLAFDVQNSVSADEAQAVNYKGSRLEIHLDSSYEGTTPSEFPNGSDCIDGTLTATKPDGTALTDTALSILKARGIAVKVAGAGDLVNTGTGTVNLCITSTRKVTSTIQVRLAAYTKVKAKAKVKFYQSGEFRNLTDSGGFLVDSPATFSFQTRDWMQNNIRSVKIHYIYNRRYQSWGKWRTRRQEVVSNMSLPDSDGISTVQISGTDTAGNTVSKAKFIYKFEFTDEKGTVHRSRSYRGVLKTS